MEKIKEKGQLKNKKLLNYGARERTIFWITVFVILFADILIWGTFIGEDNLYVDLLNKFQPPSLDHLFGTDWVGRDMLTRTIKGLSISMKIGILATLTSTIIAVLLGIIGHTFGK